MSGDPSGHAIETMQVEERRFPPPAGFAAAATVRRAALIAMHFAFHVAARAARVSAFSLCRKILQEFFRSCEGYCRRAGDPRSHADKLSSQRHGRRADRSASLKTTKL